ncbi:hypothetical protein CSUB01_12429 [Colletotrichum sublineola]|uniref:Uncharacterized protein n=1 Tax=Colletotrichum sublineola TaxID=1173701 RepID=A0A066XK39_COLSU|nr:hypothetical protein CSUB01_12429 [Colletotrichum sublineola]
MFPFSLLQQTSFTSSDPNLSSPARTNSDNEDNNDNNNNDDEDNRDENDDDEWPQPQPAARAGCSHSPARPAAGTARGLLKSLKDPTLQK